MGKEAALSKQTPGRAAQEPERENLVSPSRPEIKRGSPSPTVSDGRPAGEPAGRGEPVGECGTEVKFARQPVEGQFEIWG